MSGEKEYKYRVEKDDSIRDVKRVYTDSNRRLYEVTRNGRRGIYKPTLNVRAKSCDVAEDKKTCAEYGEFIAHKMLEKIGIPSCDVDMVKRFMSNPRSKSGKGNDIPGVISYIDLEDGETLVPAMTIVSWFRYEHEDEFRKIVDPLGLYGENDYRLGLSSNLHNDNIEVIIPAFMAYARELGGATEKEAEEIKQRIIEMVTFDCRNANRDRHDENYGLAVKDGKVRFYPLFDNEYILGFSEPTSEIEKYSAARLQEHLSKDLHSVMGITSQPTKIAATSMMTYLFSTYPEEAQKAYEKVMSFSIEDLMEIMEECEGLPEQNKAYAARIFRIRGKELESIQQEYIDEHGKPIAQILPGNKPMELIKGTGSSTSRDAGKEASKELSETQPSKKANLKKEKTGMTFGEDD